MFEMQCGAAFHGLELLSIMSMRGFSLVVVIFSDVGIMWSNKVFLLLKSVLIWSLVKCLLQHDCYTSLEIFWSEFLTGFDFDNMLDLT
jgi:hypothetical protein